MERQPARRRIKGATSGPWSTVERMPGARNVPAGLSPSRGSRIRVDGRTKRAAGRAAYLAAMLCSMGRNGTRSVGPRNCISEGAAHGSRRLCVKRAASFGQVDFQPPRRDIQGQGTGRVRAYRVQMTT